MSDSESFSSPASPSDGWRRVKRKQKKKKRYEEEEYEEELNPYEYFDNVYEFYLYLRDEYIDNPYAPDTFNGVTFDNLFDFLNEHSQ
jgi:hypothetical protein